jgi:hypothetical protein
MPVIVVANVSAVFAGSGVVLNRLDRTALA